MSQMLALVLLLATWDGPSNPELRSWFAQVRNPLGQVCCDETEVVRVQDYSWSAEARVWNVQADGVIYHVPPSRVVAEPNKAGQALIWFYPKGEARSDATARCFLRGSEG